ncbi:superoxide dismutase family protein [Vibrio parahaemolyticus]|uniref:superoxide dismutase family protein n=1 Tax=Vibrio parahaemolyticus TaxID=670 RepID=UPI0006A75718|nr:superoxide dismutase family protein [Vibrio parahaemolyticus]EHK2862441.1 superoxide dismutase family protein [Vibrio parahaemolyticus]EHK9098326.1 superoxide dismutase family protein [Vibrio parahaemolyticus]EIA1331927.1 superoxide dismutase family protein [Vibrio parahaemolyticus]EIT7133503.1 superoxide dismutase family protein [Vibrio parahaemolyticus]EIV8629315.1 superoxide dismutase family protein [Vibrio parahaemolyticus]
MLKGLLCISAAAAFVMTPNALAQSITMTDLGTNQAIGTVELSESDYGIVFTPNLSGIPAGLHGFHVHANPSCDSAEKDGKTVVGGGAGGHYDPDNTGQHGFPWTDGNHLGDLPALYADMEGNANQPVLAPRLKMSDLKGRALMIHAGGDNHSDQPAKLGGGGARIVCGVID